MLEGKRIILTGASSGIGKALALGLADLGAYMGLMSRSKDALSEICNEIVAKGGKATFVPTDVMLYEDVKKAIDTMVQKMGGVDVLINNAGVTERNIIPESPREIDKIINTNLRGPIYCTLAVTPYFEQQKGGSVINTSSVSSLETTVNYLPYNVLYVTTKAGVNMFTFSLADRLKGKKIRVNALLPGFVDTPMIAGTQEDQKARAGVMTPEELIPFYAYFASDLSKNVSGLRLPVELFKSVQKFASKLPPEQVETWEALAPLIPSRFNAPKYQVYGDSVKMLQDHHDLLMLYLNWGKSK